jgi:hypothetical protein
MEMNITDTIKMENLKVKELWSMNVYVINIRAISKMDLNMVKGQNKYLTKI